MVSVHCDNCGEDMVVASFTLTVDKLRMLPQAQTRFWLVKFVCPFCYFVKTLDVDFLTGNRYFRTLKAMILWYYFILKGKSHTRRI
jgi:hypothetical protein